MALVHDTFIRALNTIYLSAPLITPKSPSWSAGRLATDFLTYCTAWSALVALHHKVEESFLFAAIEDGIQGAKGILDENVEQHRGFHDGLKAFERYCGECLERKGEFEPERLKSLTDGFAPALLRHPADEMPTLLRLEELKDQAKVGKILMRIYEEFEVLVRKDVDAAKVASMTLLNADKTFEDGKHPFPVMPWFVPYLVKYLVSRKYAGAWKFGSCDYWGRPRTLWIHSQQSG